MAGSIKVIDTATALVADRNVAIPGGGAHGSVNFYVDVTAITRTTGTLVVTLRWKTLLDATDVEIATIAGLSATGVARIVPTANVFGAAGLATPEPTEVLWDLVGDTTAVSGKVYAIYGD